MYKMQAEVNKILKKALQQAKEYDRIGNIGKAYACYITVAELCPARRLEIEEQFTDVLCEWGIQLAERNRFAAVVQCYKHSLDIYPNNPRMLNNFAAHLLRNSDPLKAIDYLKRALKVDPTFLPAERNLQNAHSMAVDRWHFTMLNDKKRNSAFEHAIRKRISQGYNTVLDVGTGTGLLSLYAKDAGAKHIYACECSEIMTQIAKEVFESNNASDIKLIPKSSFKLEIPIDIPERVKLIVTETFDAGLFGELVVPSMIKMHMSILDSNGMIIPMSATVYVAAIECEYIRHKSSMIFDKVSDNCPLSFGNICVLSDDEYYDTENLAKVQINYITEPKVLFTINFNNLLELQEFYCKDGIKQMLEAKCRYTGIIDGLVAWFELHLDEKITLNSSDGESCWQLAVFPTIPVTCSENDLLTIKAEMSNSKLKCSYNRSSPASYELYKVYRLPKETIVFLNDFDYIKLLIEISRHQASRKIQYILDTSPFPIYGLTLLKECKDSEILYYKTDDSRLKSLVEQIAQNNGLESKVYAISSYNEIRVSLDSIFVHNFDMKGELKDDQDSYEIFKHLLNTNGILLPERVFLIGQLVYSEDLPNMVCVQNANLQRSSCFIYTDTSSESKDDLHVPYIIASERNRSTNYRIAEYINKYKISQVFDLNLSLYSREVLSEARKLIEINEMETTEAIVNFGKIDSANMKTLPNALVCWYKIQLDSEHIYDTKKNNSFMNHTAIVLEDELRNIILRDEEVKIKIYQMKGLVKISLLNL